MTILDSNHILRWVLNDLPIQSALVSRLLYESADGELIIDRVCLAEITYVLRQKDFSHAQITVFFDQLRNYTSVKNFDHLCDKALSIFAVEKKLDFEDCILLAYNILYGYNIATFDKKLVTIIDRHNQSK
jgi:predicted nucleic acid-binding protein